MDIRKEQTTMEPGTPDEQALAEINRLAKTPLAPEQVYTFAVRLCDNEVDRDLERFDPDALEELGRLFLGKSGVFDHQWSAQGQTARIYRTEVIREAAKTTEAGDEYRWLKGWAYLLRTEKNAELIAEIEGGIKKEVSVGCSMGKSVCSICGAADGCSHEKGQRYGGKLCFRELRQPLDAYEWSFVAVPAQRSAGILKRFCQESEDTALLRKQAALGVKYLASLRREVVRLAMLSDDALDGEAFAAVAAKLDEPELLALRKSYAKQAARRFPTVPQLGAAPAKKREDETVFLV